MWSIFFPKDGAKLLVRKLTSMEIDLYKAWYLTLLLFRSKVCSSELNLAMDFVEIELECNTLMLN